MRYLSAVISILGVGLSACDGPTATATSSTVDLATGAIQLAYHGRVCR